MKVAVSVNEDEIVAPHFGKSKVIYIFDVMDNKINFVEARVASTNLQKHDFGFIADCEAVISGSIGLSMQDNLRKAGMMPIVSNEEDPVKAIEVFIREKSQ
ncbi:NifB/NifX family molybdenum-iron cluster-binding protein [Bacillota bacterium LX-D]|nr:NifB/NifX family molybdenum-iron cluster-binding protein [Bacillota bacterium LX-D]